MTDYRDYYYWIVEELEPGTGGPGRVPRPEGTNGPLGSARSRSPGSPGSPNPTGSSLLPYPSSPHLRRDVAIVRHTEAGVVDTDSHAEWIDIFLPRTAGPTKLERWPRQGDEVAGFRLVTMVDLYPERKEETGTLDPMGPTGPAGSTGLDSSGLSSPFSPSSSPASLLAPVEVGFHVGGYYITRPGPGLVWEGEITGDTDTGAPSGSPGPGAPAAEPLPTPTTWEVLSGPEGR